MGRNHEKSVIFLLILPKISLLKTWSQIIYLLHLSKQDILFYKILQQKKPHTDKPHPPHIKVKWSLIFNSLCILLNILFFLKIVWVLHLAPTQME